MNRHLWQLLEAVRDDEVLVMLSLGRYNEIAFIALLCCSPFGGLRLPFRHPSKSRRPVARDPRKKHFVCIRPKPTRRVPHRWREQDLNLQQRESIRLRLSFNDLKLLLGYLAEQEPEYLGTDVLRRSFCHIGLLECSLDRVDQFLYANEIFLLMQLCKCP